MGILVALPELHSEGPARLLAQRQKWAEIVFLRSGAQMTVEAHSLMRYILMPRTRVEIESKDGVLTGNVEGIIAAQDASSELQYRLRCADDTVLCTESAIRTVLPATSPLEQLIEVGFHDLAIGSNRSGKPLAPRPWGPQTLSAREELLSWSDRCWSSCAGVLGLYGARIDLLPHQILTAERVLRDREVRFLLADEVGLGKTIEAGLIMQSLLAINPRLRVLVVAPGSLIGQWFFELYVKFGGHRFTMLDSERIKGSKNPWGEQLSICSSRAIEQLDGKEALRFATTSWDLLIVDECHRMQPEGLLYRRLAVLSAACTHVLLLSATPARAHHDAYLALLHLLQPKDYRLEDSQGFAETCRNTTAIASLIRACEEADPHSQQVAQKILGKDEHLQQLFAQEDYAQAANWLRTRYNPDLRVIRHRRRHLARLAAHTGIKSLVLSTREYQPCPYSSDAPERAVRQAAQDYRALMLAAYTAQTVPPRLLHWLLQLDLALASHPNHLRGLLGMRAAILADPEDYALYQARAHARESLDDVLRDDCSDSEYATHIAISAAAQDPIAGESEALQRLIGATQAWSKHLPQRLRCLCQALESFWKEHPQEKVLLFTNHALTVEALSSHCMSRFGAAHVAEFGAHQDAEEREQAASRFVNHEDCWLLISDALGGEGRNFQCASLIVHHDLPWSIQAVEQRIGRVDRLGRDGLVPSLVCQCSDEDAIDGAWAALLAQAVGVFSASASGLEFLSTVIEKDALLATCPEGAAGLVQALPALSQRIKEERRRLAEDDDEAFADDAAALMRAAEIAQQVESLQPPIPAISQWLRCLGGQGKSDPDDPTRYLLRPRSANVPIEGCFQRKRALRQLDYAFFARGHQLIDHLVDEAAQASWCMANAWQRSAAGIRWEGLRARLRLDWDFSPLLQAGLPLDILRRLWTLCPPIPDLLCVRMDGQPEHDEQVLDLLRPGFSPARGDRSLNNRVSRGIWMQAMSAGKGKKILDWQARLQAAGVGLEQAIATRTQDFLSLLIPQLDTLLDSEVALSAGRRDSAVHCFGAQHPSSQRLAQEYENDCTYASCLRQVLAGASLRCSTISHIILS